MKKYKKKYPYFDCEGGVWRFLFMFDQRFARALMMLYNAL